MGVADRVSISTPMKFCFSFSLWRTPKRCSSSMMTRPRSWKRTSLDSRAVGAHHDVHAAGLQAPQGLFLLLGGAEAAEQLHLDGESLHPGQDGVVVLPGQQGGGGQDGALLAPHHALEGGPQGHLGLADPHVPAQQPVHGPGVLHIVFDLGGGGQLVLGSSYSKRASKSCCHSPSGGKAKPLACLRRAYSSISSWAISSVAFLTGRGCAATRPRPAWPA